MVVGIWQWLSDGFALVVGFSFCFHQSQTLCCSHFTQGSWTKSDHHVRVCLVSWNSHHAQTTALPSMTDYKKSPSSSEPSIFPLLWREVIGFKENEANPGDSHPSWAALAVTNLPNAELLTKVFFWLSYTRFFDIPATLLRAPHVVRPKYSYLWGPFYPPQT